MVQGILARLLAFGPARFWREHEAFGVMALEDGLGLENGLALGVGLALGAGLVLGAGVALEDSLGLFVGLGLAEGKGGMICLGGVGVTTFTFDSNWGTSGPGGQ